MKRLGLGIALGLGLLLTGCAAAPATPAPTVTVPGPTVTATAAPLARAGTDPLTALDAWLACSAIAHNDYRNINPKATVDWDTFKAQQVKDNGDSTFSVQISFMPTGGAHGDLAKCTIGGTMGSPDITSFGFTDLG